MTALLLSAVLSTSAWACPDEAGTAHASTEAAAASGEKKAGCQMPSAEATTAALPADGTHAFLAVSGMHCGACADKVHTALMAVPGVKGAKVDLAANKVEVAFDAGKTSLDKLVAAVATNTSFTASVAKN